MSLLDKFKNLFTDEEEIEEEIPIKSSKKEKEENVLPTFMREKIEREEGIKNKPLENTSDLVREIPKPIAQTVNEPIIKEYKQELKNEFKLEEEKNTNFKFPIAFEEQDFVETTRQSKQNVIYHEQTKKKEQEEKKKKTSEIYGSKKEKKETPKFKATPIISPVYGILDKNYKKEEVKVNEISDPLSDFEPKSTSRNVKVDFESVRKKAYGSLTDEIKDNLICENCELLKEAKRNERANEQELLYDIKENNYHNNEISIEEAEENYYDFGVSYEPTHNIEETAEVKIVNHLENNPESEQIQIEEPIKKQPSLLSTLKKSMGDCFEEPQEVRTREKKSIEDLELTDDLFNLIDSMYEERNDN